MSNTMTFRMNKSGGMKLVDKTVKEVKFNEPSPVKKVSKLSNGYTFSVVPISAVVASAMTISGEAGVFWSAFMNYIFPWILDLSKVFCAIKIAQGFYMEHRGGRDSGSGMGTFVTYGKWYILIAIIPFIVELLDQITSKMLLDLRVG